MALTTVTWNSGDLVTSTKLQQMQDNTVFLHYQHGQFIWLYQGNGTSNNEAWEIIITTIQAYIPTGDRDSLTLQAYLKTSNGNSTAYLGFQVYDGTTTVTSTTESTTSTAAVLKTVTCDTSTITQGFVTIYVRSYITSAIHLATVTSPIVLISPE